MKPLTSDKNLKDTLYALDDAALLLQLVCALQPPEPEFLPFPVKGGSTETQRRFESPMPRDLLQQAIRMLEHSAIQLAVLQVGLVLGLLCKAADFPDDGNRQQALQIVRLIQNAYADNPCHPVWRLDTESEDISLCVPDVLALDTAGLNGERVDVLHFGGADAILRLLEYTRRLLEA